MSNKCKKCRGTKQEKRNCYYGFICHKNGMPPIASGLIKINCDLKK